MPSDFCNVRASFGEHVTDDACRAAGVDEIVYEVQHIVLRFLFNPIFDFQFINSFEFLFIVSN